MVLEKGKLWEFKLSLLQDPFPSAYQISTKISKYFNSQHYLRELNIELYLDSTSFLSFMELFTLV